METNSTSQISSNYPIIPIIPIVSEVSKLMISCLHPKHVKGMYVPCNKCVLCKRNDSLNWQVRLSHEALYHTHSLFITLTYDNDSLPKDYSFKKKDVQDWQKRLREHISRKFGKEERIKFFTVPEGGDGGGIREEGKNPHYHSIILGKISAEELKPIVDKTWKFGFNKTEEVKKLEANVAYVTGYALKSPRYPIDKKNKPFRLMSKGLGKRWIIDNAKQVREEGKVVHNGKPVYAPRYYIRKIWSKEKLIEKYNIAITNKHEEVRYEMAVRRISSTDPLYKERREFLVQKAENLTKKLSESKKTKFHHIASPEQLFERYKAFMISTMKSQSTKLDSRKLIIDQLETMFVSLNLETLEHPRNMGPPPI